jgi:hypothetical protein
LPISSSPAYAVKPVIPSTPNAVETGAWAGSSLRTCLADARAYDCHPTYASTMSPGRSASSFDSTTSATVPPSITSPISTGAAYDFAALMRPRM